MEQATPETAESVEPAPVAQAKPKRSRKPAEPSALVGDLTRQAEAVQMLKESFGEVMAEDEDLAADMIEGETDFPAAIEAIIVKIEELKAEAKAKKEFAKEITEAAGRMEGRAEKLRGAIAVALVAAKEVRVPTRAGTVSLTEKPITAVVQNDVEIPLEFWVEQDPKLDKTALNKAIRERDIPGCTRSDAGFTIAIRRK